jgi:hypothetical protein
MTRPDAALLLLAAFCMAATSCGGHGKGSEDATVEDSVPADQTDPSDAAPDQPFDQPLDEPVDPPGEDGTQDTPPDGDEDVTPDAVDEGIRYETCPPCYEPPACMADEVASCCTCLKLPLEDAGRASCTDMSDSCGSGPVDIACLKPDGYPTPATPETVTAHGVVDVFATGQNSDGITVEIYAENDDGTLGELLGATTSTADCAAHESELPVPHEIGSEATYCPGVCQEKKPDTDQCRDLGYFAISGIPTNTALVVKTSGSAITWRDTYAFNIWFFDDDVEGGKVFLKAPCLSMDDWRNIPIAAGDVGGVAPGRSMVAGEIHDCGDVRVYYVTVGTNPRPDRLTYFDGQEDKTYPEYGRSDYGTNLDGLYAAIEMDADQTVWVTAVASIPGEGYVSMGWAMARTFADSLTFVTLRGTRPDQVP